jgi:hypothetical protein
MVLGMSTLAVSSYISFTSKFFATFIFQKKCGQCVWLLQSVAGFRNEVSEMGDTMGRHWLMG